MRIDRVLVFSLVIVAGCATSETTVRTDDVKVKKYKSWAAETFHKEIKLQVGWYPYEEGASKQVNKEEWALSFSDSNKTEGASPVIIISYPDSSKSLTLGMDIDNALLGKLLKHSLMTEIPIQRPLTDFLKEADCATCHPAEIEIEK